MVQFAIKWGKINYNSYEVYLCGGRIYNLYVDVTVVKFKSIFVIC